MKKQLYEIVAILMVCAFCIGLLLGQQIGQREQGATRFDTHVIPVATWFVEIQPTWTPTVTPIIDNSADPFVVIGAIPK